MVCNQANAVAVGICCRLFRAAIKQYRKFRSSSIFKLVGTSKIHGVWISECTSPQSFE